MTEYDNSSLSFRKMAEKLGISKTSTVEYLQAKGNPRADTIELIYKRLGCSLERFVEDNPESDRTITPEDFASLVGRPETLHPMLDHLVRRSYEMALEILTISDALNEADAANKVRDGIC